LNLTNKSRKASLACRFICTSVGQRKVLCGRVRTSLSFRIASRSSGIFCRLANLARQLLL
jgi:hypothetical protein